MEELHLKQRDLQEITAKKGELEDVRMNVMWFHWAAIWAIVRVILLQELAVSSIKQEASKWQINSSITLRSSL